jgi:hypothetical protein
MKLTKEYRKSIRYFMCEMTQKEFEKLAKNMKAKPYKFNEIKHMQIEKILE